ncbi:UbiA family prenyltransferase [Candidatus Bathyarchaeota archaeon]|nr:UbiA family prenyltransferase [Candidatus Bathyarchaeota archaeon]
MRSRTEAVFTWPWITVVSCLIVGRGFPPLGPTFMAFLSVFFTAASTYIYNDYIDSEMDQLNNVKRNRPIVTGDVSMGFAKWFIAITAVAGLGTSFMINRLAFLSNLAFFTLFFIYSLPSIRIKKMFVLKEMTISSAFILCSLVGAAAISGTFHLQSIYMSILLMAFSFFGQPGLNDQFDILEDEHYGVRTMAVAFSWDTKVKMLMISVMVPALTAPLTYRMLGFTALLPVAAIALTTGMLWFILKLRGEYVEEAARRTRKLLYAYFFLLQLALIASASGVGLW